MKKLSLAAKVVLGLTLLFSLWLTGEAIYEATRMVRGGTTLSPVHAMLVARTRVTPDHVCEPRTTRDGLPLFEPLGHCQHLEPAYKEAAAYSIFTRHSMAGDHIAGRMLVNALHVFGAISCFALVMALLATGGSRGTHALNPLAARTLLTTIYTMAITGLTLFFTQHPGDLNYFPRPVRSDTAFLVYPFIVVFGFSFINAVCHVTIFRGGIPLKLLVTQHALSLVCSLIVFPIFVVRLFTLDMHDYTWSYNLELLILLSVYPLLDITNSYALYKTHVKGQAYDWDQHRDDNLWVFTVLVATTVLYFSASDKHYFFSAQLPVAYRVGLEMLPATVWLLSGRMIGYFRRVYGGPPVTSPPISQAA